LKQAVGSSVSLVLSPEIAYVVEKENRDTLLFRREVLREFDKIHILVPA
jgi:hypothetical protein